MKTVRISITTCCLISLVAILLQCSGEPLGNESPPIFGNERINAWYVAFPEAGFVFDTPEEVKYLVLGVFSNEEPITDGEKIINVGALEAGSRTGLEDFGRIGVHLSDLYVFVLAQSDFDELNHWTRGPGNYFWAVWGYDEWGNLTHSSSSNPLP